jgi:plasmid replication initiation protein
MSIDEFKERVGAESYDLFKNLNTRVIKPIVKEINQYTDKILTIEPIIERRKTTALKITLKTKDMDERLKLRSVINRKLNGNQLTFDNIIGEEILWNE